MFDPKVCEEISQRVSEVIATSPAKDIERNMKSMMTAMFANLDLVTREEFDVQMHVLRRTREKLGALDARLVQMDMTATESDRVGRAVNHSTNWNPA